MAGIGVKLTNIYKKNTLTTDIIGAGYSMVVTIAPMLLVIGALMIMEYFLDFSSVGYVTRELFSCTVLYIFIFSLLTASPFNSVLSKYMSDVIYEETYEDILPCYYVGMLLNISLSALVGIPFCIREYLVGKVDIIYVFTGYCGYIALVLVFYSMLYLSICKDYKKISFFFAVGMTVTVFLSFLLVKVFHWDITYGMLFSLTIGFWLIACLEMSVVRSYFKENSGKYRQVLVYFKEYWPLVVTNFLYTLGLYCTQFCFLDNRSSHDSSKIFCMCEQHMIWQPVLQCLQISLQVLSLSVELRCIFMADIKHTQKPLSVEEELILILQRRGCSVLFPKNL